MQFLRAFGIFLLLLLGSTGPTIATPSVEDQSIENQIEIAPQVSKDFGEPPFSTLTNPTFDYTRNYCGGIDQYVCHSLYETGEAERYLLISRSIDPGLGVPKIIFPFHTFL